MSEQELIVVDDGANALEVFSGEGGLNAYVEEARAIVLGFEHDLDTETGRSKTKSLAAKVSKLKTKLDGLGKDLVSEWKTKAKAVDINRKSMREQLDDLKVIARQPLTDWENKVKHDAVEKFNREKAEKLAAEKESDHEFALLMDDKITRDIEEENERLEKQAAELEAKQKAEAEANQKRLEAEAKAKADAEAKATIDKAAKDKADAEQRAKDAEERGAAAAKQAKDDAIAAEKRRVEAEEQAVIDSEAAAERAKQEQIQAQHRKEAAEKAEIEKREANKRHVGDIRKAAKESIMAIGFDEDKAKTLVLAISNGEIENVSIKY